MFMNLPPKLEGMLSFQSDPVDLAARIIGRQLEESEEMSKASWWTAVLCQRCVAGTRTNEVNMMTRRCSRTPVRVGQSYAREPCHRIWVFMSAKYTFPPPMYTNLVACRQSSPFCALTSNPVLC